jgi:NhaA family Na+:H+ antiporter
MKPLPKNRAPWIRGDRPLPRAVRGPVRDFLELEVAGGGALLVATLAALVVANSPAAAGVEDFFARELTVFEIGQLHLAESLRGWINDGLMAVFFFVVGLEIKREFADGELSDPQQALLPVVSAIGGMAVPALFFVAFAGGGPSAGGWGIPMATDIAFALGVLALLGPRVPSSLRLYLLTLAIVDDVGAILVIAVFYTEQVHFGWLGAAIGLLVLVRGLRQLRVWYIPIYVVLGVAVWVAMLESGVHATIAGVALGLLTPTSPLRPESYDTVVSEDTSPDSVRRSIFEVRESLGVAERLQHLIHPWSAFLILPIFAFANARIEISPSALSDAVSSSVGLGVIVGLVVGKPLGIVAAAWLAQWSGWASLPRDCSMRHIVGVGTVAGIGFTVSLFITELAFDDPTLVADAKLAVLMASVAAAALGAALLWLAGRPDRVDVPERASAQGPRSGS